MKNILITGGCGFVGRAFTRRFLADGYCVVIVDDLSTGQHPAHWLAMNANFIFIRDDIRNFVHYAVPKDYEAIFHCAAVVGGRLTIEREPIRVATDLAIDSDFFNWCVRLDPMPRRIVYFSSSAVYPTELQTQNRNLALSEGLVSFNTNRIGMPDASYGWSKLTGELLAHHAVRSHKLPVVIYRPFSGYGETQSFDYPFPSIIRRIQARESPVTVWGSGHQVRDWIHIDDIVEGVLASMYRLEPGAVLNLGTGRGISFRALAERACVLLGHGGPVSNDSSKPEGVHTRVADTYLMNQYYVPKIGLDEGIQRVAAALDKVSALV